MEKQKTLFDDTDEAEDAAAMAQAEAELAAGKMIPHEVVREWLMKRARGEDAPPPIPDE